MPEDWPIFNCTPLSFRKGSMQEYSFNESENKTGYSLFLCLSLRQDNVIVLVRSTCFVTALLSSNRHTCAHCRLTCMLSLREKKDRRVPCYNTVLQAMLRYAYKFNKHPLYLISSVFHTLLDPIKYYDPENKTEHH